MQNTILLLIIILSLLKTSVLIAAPENVLNRSNLVKLITGNTLEGKHIRKDYNFSMFLKSDGTHVEKRNGVLKPGVWSVNSEGKLCWSYTSKDKTWCRWIVENSDGTYIKIKGSKKKVRQFIVKQGNPNKL